MSGASKKLMGTTAVGGGFTAIEDVFSTYLYTGTNADITITNGIDLAGEGGLVWFKKRDASEDHGLVDTERGGGNVLRSNATTANQDKTGDWNSFNSDGFSLSGGEGIWSGANDYASWTFRKAPKFFDVVTYTGTGSARTVSHNLGTTVGSIIIKRTDTTSNWAAYHRGNTAAPETDFLSLNLTNATADDATYWNDTAPTDSVFTVGTNAAVNASGGTYVAYLFAHDPLGPSGDGSDGLIACGSYTGNGSTDGPEIDLGWEPQWVLVKLSSASGEGWILVDAMRGWANGSGDTDQRLRANDGGAEAVTTFGHPTATGFQIDSPDPAYNTNGATYIYIAIRRGPMRAPESGTEVFALSDAGRNVAFSTGFPVDAWLGANKEASSPNNFCPRLTGGGYMNTAASDAELTSSGVASAFSYTLGTDNQDEFIQNTFGNTNRVDWVFRRAPGFFDVVAYTGDGTAGRTVSHNLGVAPEMMIVKSRNVSNNWVVWHNGIPITQQLVLNTTASAAVDDMFNDTLPADSQFYVTSSNRVNGSGNTYIAYLFASLDGVSKVGSYTGNGSSQTIDCGFTSGARFIFIKRTDSTGDWYVWDTERGIVAGDDPHLSLNTTAAEVTTDDSIDPDSSGFIVNQVVPTYINVSAASYIFYAVA